MDNHRRQRHRGGHHISSFSLTCCFQPSPPRDPSPKRTACTVAAATRRNQMRLLRFGSMPAALSSPRIGCLGQIKRKKPSSNPHMPSSAAASSSSYSSAASSSSSSSKSDRLLKYAMALLRSRPSSGVGVSVSFVENMDPPLPVVRRPARDDNSASLWQRRCGAAAAAAAAAGEVNWGLHIEVPHQQPCAVAF